MDIDTEAGLLRFTPQEAKIIGDDAPIGAASMILGKLCELRNAANGADVSYLPTPQARRAFIEQQTARIGLIDGMIEFITPYAEQQMHDHMSRFLAEQ